jgi:hypothetical protein
VNNTLSASPFTKRKRPSSQGDLDESKKYCLVQVQLQGSLIGREPYPNGDGLKTSGFSFAHRSIFAFSMTTPFGP